MIVAGKSDGPMLLVDGGIHGDEHEGPLVITTLARELDPNHMRGIFNGILFGFRTYPAVTAGDWALFCTDATLESAELT